MSKHRRVAELPMVHTRIICSLKKNELNATWDPGLDHGMKKRHEAEKWQHPNKGCSLVNNIVSMLKSSF